MDSHSTSATNNAKEENMSVAGIECSGETPDSGIDISKFNIVDYILDLDNVNPVPIDFDPMDIQISSPAHSQAVTTATTTTDTPTLTEDEAASMVATGVTVAATPIPISSQSQSPARCTLPPLRTSSRQELQRRKAVEDSQREKQAQAATNPPRQSTPVDLPTTTLPCSPQSIPREVLHVETKLENPTRYHLQQCVRNNIARFALENANQKGGSVPPGLFPTSGVNSLGATLQPRLPVAQPGSAPPNIFAPHSPHALVLSPTTVGPPPPTTPTPQSINSSLGNSVTSGCSDIIEPLATLDVDSDLGSMFTLSEIQELIISQDESENSFNYNPLLSTNSYATPSPRGDSVSNGNNMGSGGQQSVPQTPIQSPTTPDDNVRAAKDRQKKDNHNKIERRRRYLINDMIAVQGQQLPKPSEPYYEKFGDVKQNKGAILQASVDYIQLLKEDNDTLRQKDAKSQLKIQQTEQERRKLLLRIQELEQLCTRSGITIPEEDLTWKPQQPERIANLLNEVTIKQEPKFCEMMEEGNNLVSGDPMLSTIDDLDQLDDGMQMELS